MTFRERALARFPAARVLAVSNSASQRQHILARAAERGLTNLEVATADMNAPSRMRRPDWTAAADDGDSPAAAADR